MSRASSLFQRTVALLLPFVFLWAWANCLALCSEAVAADENISAVSIVTGETECPDLCCFNGCSIKAVPAALQERHIISAVFSRIAGVPPFRYEAVFPLKYASNINLYSPPEIVFPRFLRLRNFRI